MPDERFHLIGHRRRRHRRRSERSAVAWLATCGAVALVAVLCVRAFPSDSGRTWSSTGPTWVAGRTPPAAGADPAAGDAGPDDGAGSDNEDDDESGDDPRNGSGDEDSRAGSAAGRTPGRTSDRLHRPAPDRQESTDRSDEESDEPVRTLGPANAWELWFTLSRYCADSDGGARARLRSSPTRAQDNWECVRRSGRGSSQLIDMDAACRHVYGSGSFARAGDDDDAFSWRCLRRG